MKTKRRLKTIKITIPLLEQVMIEGTSAFVTNIPKNTKIVSVQYKKDTHDEIWVVIENSEFDVVPEGKEIPIFDAVAIRKDVKE